MPSRAPFALLGCIPLILAGCAKGPLDQLQQAASQYQSCMVQRSYKEACVSLEETLETARLVAIRDGLDPERINAAQALGIRSVKGSQNDSPYVDFLKRRKEVIADNLIRANEAQLREDEALARTLEEMKNNRQPLTARQQAEMLLIQSLLEEKYPTYFAEPANGIESDPEILGLVCKEKTQANLSQACKRFRQR